MIAQFFDLLVSRRRQNSFDQNPATPPTVGDLIGPFSRKLCWEATGIPRTVYLESLGPNITKYLDVHFGCVPGNDNITISLYMIGESVEKASPTLLFISKNPETRREARKVIKESGIMSRFPDFQTKYVSKDPGSVKIEPLASGGGPPALPMDLKVTSEVYTDTTNPVRLLGMPIYVCHSTSIRSATANVVRVGDRICLQTANHVFHENLADLVDLPYFDDDDLEIDSDSDSDMDDNINDEISVAITSIASTSPDSWSDTASSNGSADSRRSSISVFSDVPTPKVVFQPRDTDVMLHDAATKLSSFTDKQKKFSSKELAEPESLRPVGRLIHSFVSHDTALIEITDKTVEQSLLRAMDREDSPAIAYSKPAEGPREGATVYTHTSSGGMLTGALSATSSYMRLAHSSSFQEVYTVRFNGSLYQGVCGSAVIDEKTGETYGHLVAGCRTTGMAYILSAPGIAGFLAEAHLSEIPAEEFSCDELVTNGTQDEGMLPSSFGISEFPVVHLPSCMSSVWNKVLLRMTFCRELLRAWVSLFCRNFSISKTMDSKGVHVRAPPRNADFLRNGGWRFSGNPSSPVTNCAQDEGFLFTRSFALTESKGEHSPPYASLPRKVTWPLSPGPHRPRTKTFTATARLWMAYLGFFASLFLLWSSTLFFVSASYLVSDHSSIRPIRSVIIRGCDQVLAAGKAADLIAEMFRGWAGPILVLFALPRRRPCNDIWAIFRIVAYGGLCIKAAFFLRDLEDLWTGSETGLRRIKDLCMLSTTIFCSITDICSARSGIFVERLWAVFKIMALLALAVVGIVASASPDRKHGSPVQTLHYRLPDTFSIFQSLSPLIDGTIIVGVSWLASSLAKAQRRDVAKISSNLSLWTPSSSRLDIMDRHFSVKHNIWMSVIIKRYHKWTMGLGIASLLAGIFGYLLLIMSQGPVAIVLTGSAPGIPCLSPDLARGVCLSGDTRFPPEAVPTWERPFFHPYLPPVSTVCTPNPSRNDAPLLCPRIHSPIPFLDPIELNQGESSSSPPAPPYMGTAACAGTLVSHLNLGQSLGRTTTTGPWESPPLRSTGAHFRTLCPAHYVKNLRYAQPLRELTAQRHNPVAAARELIRLYILVTVEDEVSRETAKRRREPRYECDDSLIDTVVQRISSDIGMSINVSLFRETESWTWVGVEVPHVLKFPEHSNWICQVMTAELRTRLTALTRFNYESMTNKRLYLPSAVIRRCLGPDQTLHLLHAFRPWCDEDLISSSEARLLFAILTRIKNADMVGAFIAHSNSSAWDESNWKRRCLHLASHFRNQQSYSSSTNTSELLKGRVDETTSSKYTIVEVVEGHGSSEGDGNDRQVYSCEYPDPGSLASDSPNRCGYQKRLDDQDGTHCGLLISAALTIGCESPRRYEYDAPDAGSSYSSITS